jgi:hypothetical protein
MTQVSQGGSSPINAFGIFFIIVFAALCSGFTFEGFAPPPLKHPVFGNEYSSYLGLGFEERTFIVQGHFGVDFPLVSLSLKNGARYDFGIAGLAHLYMIPQGIKFSVDNFYAALGFYFGGKLNDKVVWRFYPVYHLSAHVADGFRGEIDRTLRAISHESLRLEVMCLPVPALQVGVAYGYYFHSIRRAGLRSIVEASVLFAPWQNKRAFPFWQVRGEVIIEDRLIPGIDIATGARLMAKRGRGVSLTLRYTFQAHPGFYFDRKRMHMYGLEIHFHI